MVNGVRFNGLHSYYDFGMWLAERPDWGTPDAKVNIVEIPGADGVLDLTEANSGEVKFTNRTITLTFSAMVEIDEQERFKAKIRNALHGKVVTIVPDDDPDWYYRGRCNVSFMNIKPWKLQCLIVVDADPYARKVNVSQLDCMRTPGISGITLIDLPGCDELEGRNTYHSDLQFGTVQFPTGLNIPAEAVQTLIIKWPSNARYLRTYRRFVQVVDSDLKVYNEYIDNVPISACRHDIALSDIINAGVDPNKVYRILVSGIGQCSAHAEMFSNIYRVWNERKTVVPEFLVGSILQSASVRVIVNGIIHTVSKGQTVYNDITFGEGWNEINIIDPIDPQGEQHIDTFMVSWREGRL